MHSCEVSYVRSVFINIIINSMRHKKGIVKKEDKYFFCDDRYWKTPTQFGFI